MFYNNQSAVNNSYATFTFYNNIVYLNNAGDKALVHNNGELVSDYNIYYPVHAGFVEVYNNELSSLDEIRQSYLNEANSFDSDPLFKHAENNDFSIDAESPAVDNGKVVNLDSDFLGNLVPYGNGPDIGLIESAFEGKKISGTETPGITDVSIYPNPTNGIFFISLSEFVTTNINIRIVDLMGRQIQSYLNVTGAEALQFDLSDIEKGIYLVNILFGKQSVSKKIIVK